MRRVIALTAMSICIPALVLADAKENAAIAALKKLGARVQVDRKSGVAKKVDFAGKPVTDDQLKHLADLPRVQFVIISGVKNSSGTYLPKQVSDKGLAHLAGLTEVRELTLDGANITDAGLKHLANMKNLQKLIISSTKVTDDGLPELAKLKKLMSLWVDKTKVTTRGVLLLKKQLPNLDVLQ